MQREVNGRVFLARDEIFRDIPGHTHDFEGAASLSQYRNAIIDGPGQGAEAAGRLVVADVDLSTQRICSLPEFADQLFADDDRRGPARLVLLPEASASKYRNACRLEIVATHHVSASPLKLPLGFVATTGKQHTGVAVHRNGQCIGKARGGYGRQSLHAVEEFLEEIGGALGGISIAHGIERDQVKVLGVEAFLNAHGALYAEPHISGEQQQGQGRSHLAEHQRVAQTQSPVFL